ncbi:HalOD1 output domain-containing protein [Haloarcula nitratireducens]|uniref:Halobacterial output domain-containing protein n=1 Tax=Haloarcula nitratireducens TaxID=2487749 RepID=A0AAW4PBQ0_9EURY|nr:HalOD1 output domain-containing protein [Halomicroarcula nitratireducens]MBX0295314.1 hypothetical protein [Halomicroarcula nitratireducens]
MRTSAHTPSTAPLVSTSFQDPEAVAPAVVQAVSNVSEDPIESLPPLNTAVDPDALAALVEGGTVAHVAFSYHGHDVVVTAAGDIEVY